MSKPSKPYTNAVINVGNVLRRFPDTGTVDELRLAIRTAVNVALDPDHEDEQRPIPGERPGPFLPPVTITRGGLQFSKPDLETRVFHHWKASSHEVSLRVWNGKESAYCHGCGWAAP